MQLNTDTTLQATDESTIDNWDFQKGWKPDISFFQKRWARETLVELQKCLKHNTLMKLDPNLPANI